MLFDFSTVEFKTTVCGADLSCDLEFRFRELEGKMVFFLCRIFSATKAQALISLHTLRAACVC